MTSDISAAQLLKAYEEMLLIRRFEEKSGQLYGMGMIAGFCHLYIGQEAVAVGVQHTLVKGDAVITSYRDHGIMLATGSDPKSVMAELLGKAGGCSQGKGGSMHMFDLEKGFFGGHGIVGAQVPIGTGIAFAHKYNNSKSVAVTYFGDGACNQGQVYEAFNMAKLWNLPVLYIIENNEYGMGTSVERSCSTTDLYKRGASFEIPGEQVNGMSYIDVYKATAKAIENIRAGFGPYIIEVKTYRYRGHSMSDPGKYRTKEEIESYRENHDPIDGLAKEILTAGFADEAKFKEVEKRCKQLVNEAAEFAINSPEPSINQLYTNIYR
jgi:pyruvate dehydrogenase E1 component alpha subunit